MDGPYTDVWSFTTGSGGTILAAPTLVAPADNSTLPSTEVTLRWSAVAGAEGYVVSWRQVGAAGRNFSWVTDPERTVTWLTPGTTYEWWAEAYNDYAIGAASATWEFTLPAAVSTASARIPDDVMSVEASGVTMPAVLKASR